MAAQIAANAQKMGIDVIYFDSESAIDPNFLRQAGCDVSTLFMFKHQLLSLFWKQSNLC
jgi:RecA/RadA recombinase